MPRAQRGDEFSERGPERVSDPMQSRDLGRDTASFHFNDGLSVHFGCFSESVDRHPAVPSESCDFYAEGVKVGDRSTHNSTVVQALSLHSHLNAPIFGTLSVNRLVAHHCIREHEVVIFPIQTGVVR